MRIKILLTLFSVIICHQVYGAELLVIAKDSCADPMCNRMGDVISCREDGTDWAKEGAGYSDPMWKIVKVPGVSKAECDEKYTKPLVDGGVVLRDRKYSVSNEMLTQKSKIVTIDPKYADSIIVLKTATVEKQLIANEMERVSEIISK